MMRVIQVAGTKGKGSTSTYLASIVSKAGYKCGLFVSPHVQEECERISIDGVNISREDLDRLLDFKKDPGTFGLSSTPAWFTLPSRTWRWR